MDEINIIVSSTVGMNQLLYGMVLKRSDVEKCRVMRWDGIKKLVPLLRYNCCRQ